MAKANRKRRVTSASLNSGDEVAVVVVEVIRSRPWFGDKSNQVVVGHACGAHYSTEMRLDRSMRAPSMRCSWPAKDSSVRLKEK